MTPEQLHELLELHDDGSLTWRFRDRKFFKSDRSFKTWNKQFAGTPALCTNVQGYRYGSIFDKNYRTHRVVWAMVHMRWPEGMLDHINGKRDDNRIGNLREVTPIENAQNNCIRSDNKSGVMGVYWCDSAGRWHAYITASKHRKFLGSFEHKADAVRVRKQAEKKFGFHENHNRAA